MTTLRHAALDNVSVSRGELLISGQPLSALIDLAGGTPCYFYDRDAILERVRMLKEVWRASCGTLRRKSQSDAGKWWMLLATA